MRHRHRLELHALSLWLAASLLALSGACVTQPPRRDVATTSHYMSLGRHYDAIVLGEFTSTSAVESVDPELGEICRRSAFSALLAKHLYRTVTMDPGQRNPTAATLLVSGRIMDVRLVSKNERFWSGAEAGRSHLDLTLSLNDTVTGELLREEKLTTRKNAYGSSRSKAYTEKNLAQEMGHIVADYVEAVAPPRN